MGPRRLRIEPEKLQRSRRLLQHDTFASTINAAFPPIFLPPSASFDPFTVPSPSPLPAGAGSDHHAVPTAAIVGGGIAGVVAIAATATVVYTIFGRVGLSCLLGPIGKLLTTCFGRKLIGPFTGWLGSLRNTLREWRPAASRRRSSDQAVDDDEVRSTKADETSHRSTASQAKSVAAAAASGMEDLRPGARTILVPATRKLEQGDVRKAGRSKRKRATSLGHVSFSCDISARRLRFFTACRTGATYRSPPASPADQSINIYKKHNYHNHYHDGCIIEAATTSYHSHGQPYIAQYYNITHHPSQSILVQQNPVAPTLLQYTTSYPPTPDVTDNKLPPSIHGPPKPSKDREHGSPFDGAL